MLPLQATVIIVPLYLVIVRLTSGRALVGLPGSQQTWTIEYLLPSIVALLLAVVAWRSGATSRSTKVLRAFGVALNLACAALLAVGTVLLWGDHM